MFYQKIVEEFEEKVNNKVKLLQESIILKLSQSGQYNPFSSPEGYSIPKFKIYSYLCIYYQAGFGSSPCKYFEMKQINTNIFIEESNFQNLQKWIVNFSLAKKQEIARLNEFKGADYFNLENSYSISLHDNIVYSMRHNKELIFQSIFLEIEYGALSHFRNIDGYLRFIEQFNPHLDKFEKLNLEISEKIKGITSQLELSRKISECKIEHRDKRQTLHNDLNIDENLKVYFYPYLKYLCAVNFTKQFRLSPTDTTSVSFYAISAIINSESKQSATYQINTIEKELNKFKCLSFYDDEFKSMIKTMLRYKFNLFESILSIYKKKLMIS